MLLSRMLRILLLGTLVFSAAWAATNARKDAHPRDDRAWKRYTNHAVGYCVNYPRRWWKAEAFDGAGMYVTTGVTKYSLPSGALDISAAPDVPALKTISLSTDMQADIDSLSKFVKAEDTKVLEQHRLTIADSDALYLKARYFDPRERSSSVKEIVLTRRDGLLYRLELQARSDQLRRFEPVFDRFVNSFQFDCQHH